MAPRFVSAAIAPGSAFFDSPATSAGEPPLPTQFTFAAETLAIASVVRTWRSTNVDRGDTYLARHWFEVRLRDGRIAVIYFDRKATRGTARWWLYTLTEGGAEDRR